MKRIDDHVELKLSDGTCLSARIWYPDKPGKYPAILEYHPYPKRYITAQRDEIGHGYFAAHNYVSLRVDMRGSGDSEGDLSDEYTDQARIDAVEVINWICKQPWCNGSVGMYGLSWGGFNGIQMATLAPEALKAVAVAGASDDRYVSDTHFKGGVMASEHFGWAATLLSFLTRPPDPLIVGDGWKDLWLSRLEKLQWILPTWLDHPNRDDYWQKGFPRADEKGLKIPTLIAAGVSDVYVNALLRMVKRQPHMVKGVVGPWGHHFPHRGLPGPDINWLHHCKRWFDRWLKDDQNGVEKDPPLRMFVTESYKADGHSVGFREGKWVSVGLDAPEFNKLGLGHNFQLGENCKGGTFQINTPATMGTAGGEFMPMGWGVDLPTDQHLDDASSVTFDTETLENAREVIGNPTLKITVSSDKPSGFIAVRLCDVAPDGHSTRISMAAHQLSTAAGLKDHEPLIAGKFYTFEIELDAVCHNFAKGHKIRLALSNSYWPMLWPSNQCDRLTIDAKDSFLSLPITKSYAPYDGFKQGDGCEAFPATEISKPIFERELITSDENNLISYRISDQAPRTRFENHGMETTSNTTRVYQVDGNIPDEAMMTVNRNIGFERGTWNVSSAIDAKFTSTSEDIKSDVTLTVKHGSDIIFERRFQSHNQRY